MTEQQDPSPSSPSPGEQLILNSPGEAKTFKDFALWAGVILLLTMTAYSLCLHGSFLWDDDHHVEQNRGIRDAEGLANIWTAHIRYLFAGEQEREKLRVYTPQYYPMTHTSYWLEYQFSGSQPNDINTTVIHVDNVILHVAGAILLWLILRELAVPGAWVAAAVWALHPVNVESVAWISERKNVLAGAFFFGAILAYLKWWGRIGHRRELASSANVPSPATSDLDYKEPSTPTATGSERYDLYALSLVLFTLAVLSKTVACSLPAVLLLIAWWKRGRIAKQDWLAALPMFVIGVALALTTSWIEHHYVRAEGPEYALSFVQRLLIAGNATWFYIFKLLLPLKLSFIYPRWDISPGRPELWIAPVATVAVLAALFALRNKIGRGPFVAAAIYVGVLLPALGFVNFYPMRYSFVADHFQYLSAAAMIALLVAVVSKLISRAAAGAPKEMPFVIAGLVLLALAVLTARQASVYASATDLWRDVVAKNANSPMAHYNYGTALLIDSNELPPDRADERAGIIDEAGRQFARTVELNPDHEKDWNNWGQTLLLQNNPTGAMEKFNHALDLSKTDLDALVGLGQAQYMLKRYDDSLLTFRKAEAILEAMRPNAPRAKASSVFESIARNLQAKGDLPGASRAYAQAVDILPLPATRYEYAQLLAKMGNRVEAAAQLGATIRQQPDFIDARIALAHLMMDVGNLNGAHEQLIAAARINTQYEPLMEAAKRWSAEVAKREAATRPATTRTTTTSPTTSALQSMIDTTPTTQPSK